jgi:signal transduction protein with GAF and PtsI domain
MKENHAMSEAENIKSEKLRRLIETMDIANLLTEPITRSIQELLRTTAADIDSGEASVLVRDGEEGDLKFLTAIGEVADQLEGVRVPAGKGIAGFVYSSGQPMAVADAGEQSSFYAEIDAQTGYSTQTILATPLRHDGEVIGVLEYVNRRGGPPYQPFSSAEMDKAALFGDAIASLVSAYESAKILRELSDRLFGSSGDAGVEELRQWLRSLRDSPGHRETMDLAVLLREIISKGEAERKLCRDILEAVLTYSNGRDETSFLSY